MTRAFGLDPPARVYRGEPNAAEQSTSHAAFQRQAQCWTNAAGDVELVSRPLRYPKQWNVATHSYEWTGAKPHEKGVDVALAIDVVRMALSGDYDHAIVFSSDGDISPAVEEVLARRVSSADNPSITVASWDGKNGMRMRPGLPRVFCHYLDFEAFTKVRDGRDHTQKVRIANRGSDGTGMTP